MEKLEPRSIVDLDKETLAGRRFGVQKLADLLNQAYMDSGRELHDRPKRSFAPSGVGYGSGTCPRKWFYSFTGGIMPEQTIDPVSMANMDYGTEAHERVQALFERMGILVEKEKVIDTTDNPEFPPIFGYVDLIIDWDGQHVVGEFKTTSQESYLPKKAKSQGAPYQVLQLLIYMKALGLKRGFLLYENKNTQKLLIVPVAMSRANQKLVDDAFDWMRLVYDNAKDGGLPKRPYTQKSVACKSCIFASHCWSDVEGTVDIPKLAVTP